MENKIERVIQKFDSFDYYVNDKISRDTEEYRKGQFAINFLTKEGECAKNVKVTVRQISHEYNFGCTLFHLNQFEDDRDILYKERFGEIFNYGVLPLYWDALEPEEGKPRFGEDSVKIWRRPPLDSLVEFCQENDIRMKGHCMVYNSFNPEWMPKSNRDIKIKIENRIKAVAERYGNAFSDLDVINEMISIYKNCYKGNAARNLQLADERDYEKWSFDACKRYFPHTRLFWNEGMHETFGKQHYLGYRSFYHMALREWLSKGVPIEGIGIQYHCYSEKDLADQELNEVCNPIRIIDALECYGEYNLPIHISEVSIPSYGYEPEDELLQAELVKRLYKLWFSNKNCNSIVWWNLADKTAYQTESVFHAGLIREDCSPKPAFYALEELIHKEWNTSFDTMVNDRLNFRGFYGNYEIEAEYNGEKIKKEFRFFKENTGYDNRLCDFRSVDIHFGV